MDFYFENGKTRENNGMNFKWKFYLYLFLYAIYQIKVKALTTGLMEIILGSRLFLENITFMLNSFFIFLFIYINKETKYENKEFFLLFMSFFSISIYDTFFKPLKL